MSYGNHSKRRRSRKARIRERDARARRPSPVIPTEVPRASRAAARMVFICHACGEACRGDTFDQKNQLCVGCSSALVHPETPEDARRELSPITGALMYDPEHLGVTSDAGDAPDMATTEAALIGDDEDDEPEPTPTPVPSQGLFARAVNAVRKLGGGT